MNNIFYFLRHGETKKDINTPINQWALSDSGIEQVKKLAQDGIFNNVDIIISSTEEKAYQTVIKDLSK